MTRLQGHYDITILLSFYVRPERSSGACAHEQKRYYVFLRCALPSHFEVTVIETQIMTSHQLTLLPHFIVAMSSLSLCYLRLSLNSAQMTVIPFCSCAYAPEHRSGTSVNVSKIVII